MMCQVHNERLSAWECLKTYDLGAKALYRVFMWQSRHQIEAVDSCCYDTRHLSNLLTIHYEILGSLASDQVVSFYSGSLK